MPITQEHLGEIRFKPADMEQPEPVAVDTQDEEQIDFLTGIPACSIDDPDCDACQ